MIASATNSEMPPIFSVLTQISATGSNLSGASQTLPRRGNGQDCPLTVPGGHFELGGFDGDPDLGPAKGVVKVGVARSQALFLQSRSEVAKVRRGRPTAQQVGLETIERGEETAALAQRKAAGFRAACANALKGEKRPYRAHRR
jgi:hypothetical protein